MWNDTLQQQHRKTATNRQSCAQKNLCVECKKANEPKREREQQLLYSRFHIEKRQVVPIHNGNRNNNKRNQSNQMQRKEYTESNDQARV